MTEVPKRRALGRGLDALLPPAAKPAPTTSVAPTETAHRTPKHGGLDAFSAPIEDLHPNRSQPRSHFDDKSLDELADSLKTHGMYQTILVRKRPAGGFEIVAGERRWRAAQRAGLHEVPVLVRELSETKAFEAALVENLQREDLNSIETSRGFQRLLDEHQHTVESVAAMLGKDRSTIANAIRLLKLPESVIDLISARELSEGHGRALLSAGSVPVMERLAREAVAKGWSVRETERQARTAAQGRPRGAVALKSANTRDLEERLSRGLGTRVTVADRKGKGHLQVSFTSYDELDRLLEVLLP